MNSGRITNYISNRSNNDSDRMSLSRTNQRYQVDSVLDKDKSNINSREVSRERDFSKNNKENTTRGHSAQLFKDKSFKLDLSSLNESKQAAKDNMIDSYNCNNNNNSKSNLNGYASKIDNNTQKVNLNMSQYDSKNNNKRSIVDDFINI